MKALRRRLAAIAPLKDFWHGLRKARRALSQLRQHLSAQPPASTAPIKLNLGAGERAQPGWLNLDIARGPLLTYADLRQPLPLADGSVAHVHCEHFLEHLEEAEARALLGECFRVLEPGASLRVIVPDAERYLHAYVNRDESFFDQVRFLGGTHGVPFELPIQIINQMFRMGGSHRYAWDYSALAQALTRAGFVDVRRSQAGDVAAGYAIDGPEAWRAVESLYVNALKPRSG